MSILDKLKVAHHVYKAARRWRAYYALAGYNALAVTGEMRRSALEQRHLDACELPHPRMLYAIQLGPEVWACLWVDGETTDHVSAPLSGEEAATLERILWWGETFRLMRGAGVAFSEGRHERWRMTWREPDVSNQEYLYALCARRSDDDEWQDLAVFGSVDAALTKIGV